MSSAETPPILASLWQKLPTEITSAIWEYVFTANHPITAPSKLQPQQPTQYRLLRTSKQVMQQGFKTFWTNTVMCDGSCRNFAARHDPTYLQYARSGVFDGQSRSFGNGCSGFAEDRLKSHMTIEPVKALPFCYYYKSS